MATTGISGRTYVEDDYSKYNSATGNQAYNIFDARTGGQLGNYSTGTGFTPGNTFGANASLGDIQLNPYGSGTPTISGLTNLGNITGVDFSNIKVSDWADAIDNANIDFTQLNNEDIATLNMARNMGGQAAFDGSLIGQSMPYIKGFAGLTSGLGSLAGIYSGFKQLDIMEDQLDIAKDQWKETKKELARVKGVRNKLNTSYMA
jgi:hypothetical protein